MLPGESVCVGENMLLTDETLLPGENTLLLSEDMVLFCGDLALTKRLRSALTKKNKRSFEEISRMVQ